MVLTDTHTHQYYETIPEKRAALMQRCIDNNITRLFLPNVDAASVPLVYGLANEYPQYCYPMLGLHPCDVKENWEEELSAIMNAHQQNRIYAIGEIGIDLYWDKTHLKEQVDAFVKQINWAKSLDLAIVIHCRDAFDEVYEVLKGEADEKLRGIFHCFGGTVEQAQKVIDLNFYLGIGGVVTYKNSGLDKVIPEIDLKHIVLETDSPYLTPVPFRGKPNESSYLVYIAQKVAELHQTSIEKVAEVTTENSRLVFGI
ncbi:TatD family deoxyribonuclease [Mucilaginibacter rubeus]|uniref:TatD family deoxyribonuclease n=1 Tax=Mucilaginibacter rubeus TaxID=2027860 RepID=A0AAE6JHZ5_9SPHI|nr:MULTISPECIES: TatD family hydrolase [Mucilaginibacter]QEM06039.1 TatD family deoxyribonuclease [Mucilaginibacter rubeus]QEM18620.1 TatD family deoxyribonuclease [Mucilaginibacter gossypii]QTE44838.1 TatD family hydrolase [Mucilaginibacter rubeus]QTE51436.1 TatD family hydrolase [Mucilaginibacter rubeus]QTE56522.1 TatD family hydrolase [Mucilaginibacter rubeus]